MYFCATHLFNYVSLIDLLLMAYVCQTVVVSVLVLAYVVYAVVCFANNKFGAKKLFETPSFYLLFFSHRRLAYNVTCSFRKLVPSFPWSTRRCSSCRSVKQHLSSLHGETDYSRDLRSCNRGKIFQILNG